MIRDRSPWAAASFLIACLIAFPGQTFSADANNAVSDNWDAIDWENSVGNSLSQPSGFYGSDEALRIAESVLLHQRNNGGWPKTYNRTRILTDGDKRKIEGEKDRDDTTFDNGTTHSEIRYLAKVYNATGDEQYKQAFLRGVEYTLEAQYENGGWPHFYPISRGLFKYITFNDDGMIGVMTALRDIALDKTSYQFVDAKLRTRCADAVAKGVECILKCQIEVDGRKTAWCAQHDQKTLAPRKARTYELVSLSGYESVGIVRFLMEIDEPTPEVIEAVQGAIAWFDQAKLTGIRQIKQEDKSTPKGWNKVVVEDADAPPMWARFYTIGTNKPIFCSRDGVPRATIAEISYERRNGYSWLGHYADRLLAEDYPAWQKKWTPADNVL